MNVEIFVPATYIGRVMELIDERRGIFGNTEYVEEERVLLTAELPLANLVVDFYDALKGATAGYAR